MAQGINDAGGWIVKIASFILIAVASLAGSHVQAQDIRVSDPQLFAEIRSETFVPLFRAMQSGDVVTIAQYFGEREYERYRVLLEQNQAYSQYLCSYYADTVFTLDKVTNVGNEYVAEVLIRWRDGRSSVVALRIAQSAEPTRNAFASANPLKWKIQGGYR
jgi:hypothetical protein